MVRTACILCLISLTAPACTGPEDAGAQGKSEANRHHYMSKTAQHALLPMDSTAVVFAGDSHVEYGHWTEWLGQPVLNRGIAGDDLPGLQARLARLQTAPGHLLLLIGYNDVLYGHTAPTILAGYRALLADVHARYPATRLTLVNLPPLAAGNAEDRQRNTVIRAVNAGLADLAAQHHLPLIDLYEAVAVAQALDPALTHDGLHLNGAGYARFAALLRPALAP